MEIKRMFDNCEKEKMNTKNFRNKTIIYTYTEICRLLAPTSLIG